MQTIRAVWTAIKQKPVRKLLEEKRLQEDYCRYAEISLAIKNMVLSMEDSEFFRHPGFLLRGYWNAALENIRRRKLVRGGSTITMQLAKNLYLSSERTLRRKMQEFLVTIYLERQLDKEEILELYFNIIYYGNGIYGIRKACEYYFHKQPKDVSVNEALTLTGLLPAPTWHNPCGPDGRAHLYGWRDRALADMCRRQVIPEKDLKAFRNTPWDQEYFGSLDLEAEARIYQHFVKGDSFREFWHKLIWKSGLKLWKLETALARKAFAGNGDAKPPKGQLQLIFVDGPSANTVALLDLLDRYHVKAGFYLDSILSESLSEEVIKRGHSILKERTAPIQGGEAACVKATSLDYRLSETHPWKIYRHIIAEIKMQGRRDILLQDTWRMNNTLVERLILWSFRHGYRFEREERINK